MMKMRKRDRRNDAPPTGGPGGRAGVLKKRTGDITDTPSRPEELHKVLPQGPAPTMSLSFDEWSVLRLAEETRCALEQTYSCVPLTDDPICLACWLSQKEDADE